MALRRPVGTVTLAGLIRQMQEMQEMQEIPMDNQTPISRQPEGPIRATHPRAVEPETAALPVDDGTPDVIFSADQVAQDPILQFFAFRHLPERLQSVSRIFALAAAQTVLFVPRSAERTVALRKLLEAKDAAVRAVVAAQV